MLLYTAIKIVIPVETGIQNSYIDSCWNLSRTCQNDSSVESTKLRLTSRCGARMTITVTLFIRQYTGKYQKKIKE